MLNMGPTALGRWIQSSIAQFWTAVLGVIAGLFVAWLFRQPLLYFLSQEIVVEVAYWQFIGLVMVFVLVFLLGFLVSRRPAPKNERPWESYTTDVIGGIRWGWRWPKIDLTSAGPAAAREIMRTLRPICPRCGGVLYNPQIDPALDHIGHEVELPTVDEDSLECMSCDFSQRMGGTYREAALHVASDVLRRARQKYVR